MKGLELRKLRKELKLTQTEFGAKIGMSKEAISLWEKSDSLSDKAERLIEDYLKEKNINISIKGNNAGGNQNFFNKDRADYNTTQSEIKLKDAEIKRLTNELLDCKNKLIDVLSKNT